jgi:diguanylate cyclase (GGDEF)-like protein
MKFHSKILLLFIVHGMAILGVGIYQIQTLFLSQENAFEERLFIESMIVQRRFETKIDDLKKTIDILHNAQEIKTGILSNDVDLLHGWGKLFIPKYADNILFINEKGVVIARGELEFRFGDSLAHAVYFQKALQKNIFIGIDSIDDVPMLIVAKRIDYDAQKSKGVLVAALRLHHDFLNNLALGTHMGVTFDPTKNAPTQEVISLHKSLDTGSLGDIGLYVLRTSHNELDAIANTRINLILGFLVLFIPSALLIYSIVFRYLKHHNTFIQLLFDFYETKISIDTFLVSIKKMTEGKASLEIKKISALFLKIVQKMSLTQDHLALLSQTDTLTAIANRRKLDDILEVKVQEASRGLLLSIILIDIDLFKKINDTYGHDTGDIILQEFAHILKNSIRQTDSVGRWGGEEFLLILPMTNNTGALEVANTLKDKIESFRFILDIRITASLGLATYRTDDTERTLLKRADDALYRAKHLGRNRIENEIL